MRRFSATELANNTGDVLAAAAQEPVQIARHGKPRFVVLTIERYAKLQGRRDSCLSVHVDDLDDAEAANLIARLQESIDENRRAGSGE